MSPSVLLNRPTLRPEERLVFWPTVLELVPLSRSTIQRQILAGEFPRPRRIARRKVAWSEAAILRWLESQTRDEAAR
jgi:predicted DNA-binding transcriptional regulator AlpA